MTTPKGKILLAKLPKDIIQYCIEPYLMISKEQCRKNYHVFVVWLNDFVTNHGIFVRAENVTLFIPINELDDGGQLWQKEMFGLARLGRKTPSKKKECCTIL